MTSFWAFRDAVLADFREEPWAVYRAWAASERVVNAPRPTPRRCDIP